LGHIGVVLAILGLFRANLGPTWLSWGAILVDLEDIPHVLGSWPVFEGCLARFGCICPVFEGCLARFGGSCGPGKFGNTGAPWFWQAGAGRFLFTGILASNRYHSDIAICFFRSSAPKSIVIARVPPCPPRACGCERILSVVHSKHDTSGQWRRISAPRRQKAGAQMWICVAYGREHTKKPQTQGSLPYFQFLQHIFHIVWTAHFLYMCVFILYVYTELVLFFAP
jgi:hypothetical protein